VIPRGSGVIVVNMLVLDMSLFVILHYSNSKCEGSGHARHVRFNNVLSRIGIVAVRIRMKTERGRE